MGVLGETCIISKLGQRAAEDGQDSGLPDRVRAAHLPLIVPKLTFSAVREVWYPFENPALNFLTFHFQAISCSIGSIWQKVLTRNVKVVSLGLADLV